MEEIATTQQVGGTTTLEVRYVVGQVHATPWDRHPNEAAVEWPPSPWRVLRALYSVWMERVPDLPESDVHSALSGLASVAPTYRLPRSSHAHTRHWYPTEKHRSDAKGYKKSLALDAFMAVDPNTPALIDYNVELNLGASRALGRLCERMTYLGRAESLVEVRLHSGLGPTVEGLLDCHPVGDLYPIVEESVRLLVPEAPLDIEALTTGTKAIQKKRLSLPPGSQQVTYSAPTVPIDRTQPPGSRVARRPVTTVMWHLSAPALPSVKAAVLQGEALHRRVLWRFGQQTERAHSATLSGKDQNDNALTDDHGHAHVLHFDLDGDRRLDTAVLWTPAGLSASEVQAVAATTMSGRWGELKGYQEVQVGLQLLGTVDGLPSDIVGPSRVWRSLTPFAPAHHAKKRQREGDRWAAFIDAQVRRECGWRGLPDPQKIELSTGEPWLQYRRHRGREKLRDARRAVGLEITFAEPVRGPVALGALSHYGLGVLVPGHSVVGPH